MINNTLYNTLINAIGFSGTKFVDITKSSLIESTMNLESKILELQTKYKVGLLINQYNKLFSSLEYFTVGKTIYVGIYPDTVYAKNFISKLVEFVNKVDNFNETMEHKKAVKVIVETESELLKNQVEFILPRITAFTTAPEMKKILMKCFMIKDISSNLVSPFLVTKSKYFNYAYFIRVISRKENDKFIYKTDLFEIGDVVELVFKSNQDVIQQNFTVISKSLTDITLQKI